MDGDFFTYAWRLGATLFFVAANGFFVAAEFALVKVRGSRLDILAAEGDRRARTARDLLNHLDHYLSACQLGITIASLILGWLAEPAIAQLLIAGVGSLGMPVSPESPVVHAVSLTIALTIVTILHMTVGEQAPKIWAIRRPEQMALLVAFPLRVYSALFRPFIWFVNGLSNALLRVAGLSSGHGSESLDVNEIKEVLATSAAAGQLSRRQVEFAANVLNLINIETRHILVPRIDVVSLSTAKTLAENLEVVRETGHSRFPLCDSDLDSIQGIVHSKDLIASLVAGTTPDLPGFARKALFVTESRPLSRLIRLMQTERQHCAVVVDEYGSTMGLVFLEDALEHVVGTIGDEFDQEAPQTTEEQDGSTQIPGGMALPEAVARLDLHGANSSADTIGGLVIAELGKIPSAGDTVRVGHYDVTVVEVDRNRIRWLRFQPIDPDADPPAETPDI
jgi:CBS domain containing-hemolysin-like protein